MPQLPGEFGTGTPPIAPLAAADADEHPAVTRRPRKRPATRRSSPRRTRTIQQPSSFGERTRERLEGVQRWLEPLGLGVHGAGFFFTWWRKLGLNWAIALTLGFFLPLSEFSLLSLAMRHGVPLAFGDFGVQFEAESWDVHLFGLRGTAHKVRLARDDRSAPVLTADEIEFNATLAGLVGRLFDRPQIFDSIDIRGGELHLEQSLAGDWNWAEFIESVPADRRTQVARGQYEARALRFQNLRVVYLENVPSGSGGGVIQTAQARIYVDDVNGSVSNLVAPGSGAEAASRFNWKGRTADGLVEVSGQASFFAPDASAPGSAPFAVRIYLENIGMGAYARMVSTTNLLPVRGNLRGTIDVRRTAADTTCISSIVADDVQFAPNPRLVLARTQYDELEAMLRGYRTSGAFDACAAGQFRNASTLLASFNAQATTTAPRAVRLAATRDQQSFGAVLASSAASDIGERLGREAVGRLPLRGDTQTGQALQREAPNAVTKGVRTVGKGFKKLFGR